MAFGFGVGDVLALTKLIIETVDSISNVPKELEELAERVAVVDMNLRCLQRPLSNVEEQNKKSIEWLAERIRSVAEELSNVVKKYGETQRWKGALPRTKFALWETGSTKKLVDTLEGRSRDMTDFVVIQILYSTNRIHALVCQQQNQDGTRIKDQRTKPSPTGQPSSRTSTSHQSDLVQSVLKGVLQSEGPARNEMSIEKEVEIQLQQAGIGIEVTSAVLGHIKDGRKQIVHPEDIDPISFLGGKSRLEISKGWIMVVDRYNEGRSIIAQVYLELVRAWTVNYNGEWLFNRVESAGVRVRTESADKMGKSHTKLLVEGGYAPIKAALQAISGSHTHFQSDEKGEILARVSDHRSRGIDHWHFRKYEYMLCFDKPTYETVKMLARCCKDMYGHLPGYSSLSKIVLVEPQTDLRVDMQTLKKDEITDLVESIKKGIKTFLRKEYDWERPPVAIADGTFRTKQIVLPAHSIKLHPDEWRYTLDDIASKTNCRIRVTDEKFDDQLFSITGQKDALSSAALLIKERFC